MPMPTKMPPKRTRPKTQYIRMTEDEHDYAARAAQAAGLSSQEMYLPVIMDAAEEELGELQPYTNKKVLDSG